MVLIDSTLKEFYENFKYELFDAGLIVPMQENDVIVEEIEMSFDEVIKMFASEDLITCEVEYIDTEMLKNKSKTSLKPSKLLCQELVNKIKIRTRSHQDKSLIKSSAEKLENEKDINVAHSNLRGKRKAAIKSGYACKKQMRTMTKNLRFNDI